MSHRTSYCSICGERGSWRKPPGDPHERFVCDTCGAVTYDNPRIIAGCLAEWEDKILICRRAIEPRYGYWTLPAGYMERGETIEQAARRETREETGADVEIETLYSLFSVLDQDQVYAIFRARLFDATLECGPENLEVRLVSPNDVPWDALAYPVIQAILERYLLERGSGKYNLYVGSLDRGRIYEVGTPESYNRARFRRSPRTDE